MTKNNSTPTPEVPARRMIVEEITDPNDVRDVEELARRGGQIRRVLRLVRSLSESERVSLLTRLVSFVADEDQIEFIGELLKLTPPDTVSAIEAELLGRESQSRS